MKAAASAAAALGAIGSALASLSCCLPLGFAAALGAGAAGAFLTTLRPWLLGLPGPSCCIQHGFHWDEAILYLPGARWSDAPAPAVWDGPVAEIVPRLERALGDARR